MRHLCYINKRVEGKIDFNPLNSEKRKKCKKGIHKLKKI